MSHTFKLVKDICLLVSILHKFVLFFASNGPVWLALGLPVLGLVLERTVGARLALELDGSGLCTHCKLPEATKWL